MMARSGDLLRQLCSLQNAVNDRKPINSCCTCKSFYNRELGVLDSFRVLCDWYHVDTTAVYFAAGGEGAVGETFRRTFSKAWDKPDLVGLYTNKVLCAITWFWSFASYRQTTNDLAVNGVLCFHVLIRSYRWNHRLEQNQKQHEGNETTDPSNSMWVANNMAYLTM